MATATLTITSWKIEYHETMAAVERAQRTALRAKESVARYVASIVLTPAFWRVNSETEKLVSCLEQLERFPSSILLHDDARKIPSALNDLFQAMCSVIQEAESLGLHRVGFMGRQLSRLSDLSQKISVFATRFDDSLTKLLSRIAPGEVLQYQDSFAGYGACLPQPENVSEDDVKTEILHP